MHVGTGWREWSSVTIKTPCGNAEASIIHYREIGQRVIRGSPSAKVQAASAVSAVDTHRWNWYSDCTDSGPRCGMAGWDCTWAVPRIPDEGARNSVDEPRRTSTRCPVAEGMLRDLGPLSCPRSCPQGPSHRLLTTTTYCWWCAGSVGYRWTS